MRECAMGRATDMRQGAMGRATDAHLGKYPPVLRQVALSLYSYWG